MAITAACVRSETPSLDRMALTWLRDREKAVVLIDDPNDINRIMEIQKVLNVHDYELRVGLAEDILRFFWGLAWMSPRPV